MQSSPVSTVEGVPTESTDSTANASLATTVGTAQTVRLRTHNILSRGRN